MITHHHSGDSQYGVDISLEEYGPGQEKVGDMRIKIRELPMADCVHGSAGCQLWDGSVALAQDLLMRPELFTGKTVVEMGADCGLTAIVVARYARQIIITDSDEDALENLAYNLRMNEATMRGRQGEEPCPTLLRVFEHTEASGKPWPLEEQADVLVASDLIFGSWGSVVAQTMLRILAPGGVIVYMAGEENVQGLHGLHMFVLGLLQAGFEVTETRLQNRWGTFRRYECRKMLPWEDPSEAYVWVDLVYPEEIRAPTPLRFPTYVPEGSPAGALADPPPPDPRESSRPVEKNRKGGWSARLAAAKAARALQLYAQETLGGCEQEAIERQAPVPRQKPSKPGNARRRQMAPSAGWLPEEEEEEEAAHTAWSTTSSSEKDTTSAEFGVMS